MLSLQMPSTKTLGQRLKELRGQESQMALAKRAGVKQSQISKWETGTEPDHVNLIRLAKAFRVSIDEVIKGIDPEYDRNISSTRRPGSGVEYSPHTQRAPPYEDPAALIRARDEYARVKAELDRLYTRLAIVVNHPDQLKGSRVSSRRKSRTGS